MISPDFQRAIEAAYQYNVMGIVYQLSMCEVPHSQTPPELLNAANQFLDTGVMPPYAQADGAARERSYGIRV